RRPPLSSFLSDRPRAAIPKGRGLRRSRPFGVFDLARGAAGYGGVRRLLSCGRTPATRGVRVSADRGAILIVDDDADFRSFVSTVVARTGLRSVEVSTGEEAIAVAMAEQPSLVVLDVRLPDINGYEVCRELREEFGEELPIVFVSGVRTYALLR